MPSGVAPSAQRIRAAAWAGIGGGVFVIAVAAAMFIFLDVLHSPAGGWGSGFFALIADLVLLGLAMAANGRYVLRHGKASGWLQGLTIALGVGVAVVAATSVP